METFFLTSPERALRIGAGFKLSKGRDSDHGTRRGRSSIISSKGR